jgi:hypothetical protein
MPVSHELHCTQHSVEEAEVTRLLKEQTRIRWGRAQGA